MMAHELGVPLTLDVVTDLASTDPADYGGNPALRVPTLVVDGAPLFGTDNICRRLAELAGRTDDPRVVLALRGDLARSAQELVWHAMAAQVTLRVGLHVAALPADNLFFAKARAGLVGALAWLEHHLDPVLAQLPAPRDVSVLELSLFCLVEHLAFRPTVPLDALPRLGRFAADHATRPSARLTAFEIGAGTRFGPAA